MSEKNTANETSPVSDVKEKVEALDTDLILNFLETLVPPNDVKITDIFGTEYEVSTILPFRKQIQVMREFDKLKELANDEDSNLVLNFSSFTSIVESIINIAENETVMHVLCSCFDIANPKVVKKSIAIAKKKDEDVVDGYLAVADLFPLEEVIASIIPLFIRLILKAKDPVLKLLN